MRNYGGGLKSHILIKVLNNWLESGFNAYSALGNYIKCDR